MSALAELQTAAMAEGQLSAKQKQLIGVGIAVAHGGGGVIALHIHDAITAGANRQELEETIGVAISMGGGSAATAGSAALEAMDQFFADAGRAGTADAGHI